MSTTQTLETDGLFPHHFLTANGESTSSPRELFGTAGSKSCREEGNIHMGIFRPFALVWHVDGDVKPLSPRCHRSCVAALAPCGAGALEPVSQQGSLARARRHINRCHMAAGRPTASREPTSARQHLHSYAPSNGKPEMQAARGGSGNRLGFPIHTDMYNSSSRCWQLWSRLETACGCVRDEKFCFKELSLKNEVRMVRLQVGWKKQKRKMDTKIKVCVIFLHFMLAQAINQIFYNLPR